MLLSAVIIFFAVFYILRYYSNNPYQKRMEWTLISLNAIRYDISIFHNKYGRWPESLLEIKEQSQKEDKPISRENKEYLSCQEGNNSEATELNNKGGWYYDPKNGKVKINLNKPLHTYFSNYYYLNRNKIPSEW